MQGLGKPVPCRFQNSSLSLRVEMRDGLTKESEDSLAVWTGTAALYSLALYTQARFAFENSGHVLS